MRLNPKLTIAVLIGAMAASSPIVAQIPKVGAANPAAVTGGVYKADPGHTLVTWTLDHLGFSPYTGLFGDITGTLTLDPRRPNAAQVDMTIPVSKIVTASAALTSHLLRPGRDGGRPDFFGASPSDARFVSTRVIARGRAAKVTGDLTLNGVTRPVVLDVMFYGAGKAPERMGGKENIGFTATGRIKRSAFGLDYGVPGVGDDVTLSIAAAFVKQ